MRNAQDMVAKRYKGEKFKGHELFVYKVPHETQFSGYDVYPPDQAEPERRALSNPKATIDAGLASEFKLLMLHHRSSLYRQEFAKCSDPDCPLCSKSPPTESPHLDSVMNRFPAAMLPTPVPVLRGDGEYPALRTLMRAVPEFESGDEDLDSSDDCSDDEAHGSNRARAMRDFVNARTGRYRTLVDLLKMTLPDRFLYPDSHYCGTCVKISCLACNRFTTFKSEAALMRHKKLVHLWNIERG